MHQFAQFDAKVRQLAADTDARYVAALKKQKLKPITLPQVTWDTNGVGPAAPDAGGCGAAPKPMSALAHCDAILIVTSPWSARTTAPPSRRRRHAPSAARAPTGNRAAPFGTAGREWNVVRR